MRCWWRCAQILNGTPFEQLQIEGQPVYYQVIDSHNVMKVTNLSGNEPIQPMTEGVPPRELPGKSSYERLSQRVINPATGKLTYTVQVASSLDSADRSVQTVQRSLLIATPLLIALVAAMVWTFVGRAFRPVAKIREEVESISASTIDRRVPVPDTHDEVAVVDVADNQSGSMDGGERASGVCDGVDEKPPVGLRELL